VKVVLFDLGRTLEDQGVLLPGAVEALEGIQSLRDAQGQPAVLGLVSDFDMPGSPSEVPGIQQEYYAVLDGLGIRPFFEPVARRVTLSTEVGEYKPHEKVFRTALDKVRPGLPFAAALFVTENPDHVEAAGLLGMRAVHFRGPGQTTGEVTRLVDLIPLVREFLGRGEGDPPAPHGSE
jgi:FMN phosphatase YigB (HAD superfamily)